MKFNTKTKELFADNGILLKKMHCPVEVNWASMEPGKNDLERICKQCNRAVMNTEYLTEDEVIFVLRNEPEKCLKINVKKF